jgi:hypothetical protein
VTGGSVVNPTQKERDRNSKRSVLERYPSKIVIDHSEKKQGVTG